VSKLKVEKIRMVREHAMVDPKVRRHTAKEAEKRNIIRLGERKKKRRKEEETPRAEYSFILSLRTVAEGGQEGVVKGKRRISTCARSSETREVDGIICKAEWTGLMGKIWKTEGKNRSPHRVLVK